RWIVDWAGGSARFREIHSALPLFFIPESVRFVKEFRETRSRHSDRYRRGDLADAGLRHSKEPPHLGSAKRCRPAAGPARARFRAHFSRGQNRETFGFSRQGGAAEFLGDLVRALQG